MKQLHEIDPVYYKSSSVLIIGSFPSVKSREAGFFYAHPQNRFWRVISAVTGCDTPNSTADKKGLLLENHIAVWDVIRSCDIAGSADSSIKNVTPNDIGAVVRASQISRIFCNGAAAYDLYIKYCLDAVGIIPQKLPSTSPANARFSLNALIDAWKIII